MILVHIGLGFIYLLYKLYKKRKEMVKWKDIKKADYSWGLLESHWPRRKHLQSSSWSPSCCCCKKSCQENHNKSKISEDQIKKKREKKKDFFKITFFFFFKSLCAVAESVKKFPSLELHNIQVYCKRIITLLEMVSPLAFRGKCLFLSNVTRGEKRERERRGSNSIRALVASSFLNLTPCSTIASCSSPKSKAGPSWLLRHTKD